MGKIVTILGGCLVAAAGVSYGVYSHYEGGCAGHAAACAKQVVVTDCCTESAGTCPLSAETPVSAEGSCPLAAGASCCESSKAAALVKASAPSCCEEGGPCCDSGLAAVAGGAAAFAGKK